MELPRTVDEIFAYRYLQRKIQERQEHCRAILEICLASRRPININILYNCLNVEEDCPVEWTVFLQVNEHTHKLHRWISFVCRVSRVYRASSLNFRTPPMRSFTVPFALGYWLIRTTSSPATSSNFDHERLRWLILSFRKGQARLALYLSRSFTTPLHGPDAIECIRHLSSSDLVTDNFQFICQRMKTLIEDPSRLLASLRNAFYPELDISELLLMTAANPDTCVDSIHMPLLCIAAQHGYLAFVSLLLKYQANVNIITKNNENKTALMLAADCGHEEIVKLLIDSHADVSIWSHPVDE